MSLGSLFRQVFSRPVSSLATAGVENATPGIPLGEYEDARSAMRFGYGGIILGLGAMIVWAIFAPIGEGIPAQGTVVTESHRKMVSHLSGGTVAAVHVTENQIVNEGDVLIELESDRAENAYYTALHEQLNAGAKLARMSAEQGFSPRIAFPEDVWKLAADLGREDILKAQEQLFVARRRALENEESILRETLSGSSLQVEGLARQITAKSQQETLLSEELASNRELVESGYTAKHRLFEQERQLAELQSVISELRTRSSRERSMGAETRLRLLQRRQEFLKELETQASEVRRDYVNFGERVKDAKIDLDRTIIKAPVGGQVMSMLPQAPGSIITPGAKLMEVVPSGDKLLFDVKVPLDVVQRAVPGLDTDIQITSFPDTPTLILDGKLLSISTDSREPTNPADKQPYYLARVEVTPEGIAKLEGKRLRPGMTASVIIKTGERSFMAYLIAPFNRSLFSAFKEI